MKKVFIVFCLFLIPIAFVYSQSKVRIDCKQNLKNIFKIQEYKYKYEIVQFIYKYRNGGMFVKNDYFLNYSFELIRGYPYFEEKPKVWKGGPVRFPISEEQEKQMEKVEWMSKEELDRYLEQLNYTPEEALIDYSDFIQNIKLEKEMYLKCIDEVIVKRNTSKKYTQKQISYYFTPPHESLLPPLMTKLDFLKVFKEFILINDEEILPDYWKVNDFLKIHKCNLRLSDSDEVDNLFIKKVEDIDFLK